MIPFFTTTPLISNSCPPFLGDASGTTKGIDNLKEYFKKGLEAYPDLKFELSQVLTRGNSVTPYYKSLKGMLAAEVMVFNKDGKIRKVIARYSEVK